jgi:methylated-DNA-protein-cysteine methyltransferase-like protein
MPPTDELWTLIKRIPRGKITSYGEIGKALHNPASGYFVGRWMLNCPPDIPWWRVVGKNGTILLGKRSPELAAEQESRLRQEGIKVEDGQADKSALIAHLDLIS